MPPHARRLCQLAALLLALATLIGAIGEHGLRTRLSADHFEVLQTVLRYQFFQSLGLLGLGLLLDRWPQRLLRGAAWLLLAGIVLFCGSLYAILAGAPRLLGALTPLGGLAMMVAWCLAAVGLGATRLAAEQQRSRS
jgi:uncharacterized membrane protein YgdD (TMEM256/DUF423 family)